MINQLFFGFTIFKIEQHLFFSYNWPVFGKPENWKLVWPISLDFTKTCWFFNPCPWLGHVKKEGHILFTPHTSVEHNSYTIYFHKMNKFKARNNNRENSPFNFLCSTLQVPWHGLVGLHSDHDQSQLYLGSHNKLTGCKFINLFKIQTMTSSHLLLETHYIFRILIQNLEKCNQTTWVKNPTTATRPFFIVVVDLGWSIAIVPSRHGRSWRQQT
jgi:hypothetical protein